MKTIQQKRLEFLDETVNHYNSLNRCDDERGCRYSPKTLNLEGVSEGCAIGRKLTNKLALRLDSEEFKRKSGIFNDAVFNLMPKKLKELGQSFLRAVQNLHDNDAYWYGGGISDEGMLRYKGIKKDFCTLTE